MIPKIAMDKTEQRSTTKESNFVDDLNDKIGKIQAQIEAESRENTENELPKIFLMIHIFYFWLKLFTLFYALHLHRSIFIILYILASYCIWNFFFFFLFSFCFGLFSDSS